MELTTTGPLNTTTIEQVMVRQSPTTYGWICPQCKHHEGYINCAKNVLICYEFANMSGCIFYEPIEKGKL
jgi:hypothetical protein